MRIQRRSLLVAGIGTAATAGLPVARAETWPTRALKIVYTFAPGGAGDAATRAVAASMATSLGQPVIVENRAGANGTVGTLAAARSPADGYTLLVTTVTTVVQTPIMAREPGFDPLRSLVPIGTLSVTPLVLLAHASVPANDFPSFLDWARRQPGGVDIAMSGAVQELANALLAKAANFRIVNVMYKGSGPALQAVLAGDVKVYFNPPSATLMEFVRQGRVKVIGVTSDGPSPVVPGGTPINTFLPGYVQDINFAMWAPAGTPPAVAARLTAALAKALAEPGTGDRFLAMGTALKAAGPDEVTRIAQRDAATIKLAVDTLGFRFGE